MGVIEVVTNGDMGEGEGIQKSAFFSVTFLNGPRFKPLLRISFKCV